MLIAAISVECSRSPLLLITTLAIIGTVAYFVLSDVDVTVPVPDTVALHKKVQTALHAAHNLTKG